MTHRRYFSHCLSFLIVLSVLPAGRSAAAPMLCGLSPECRLHLDRALLLDQKKEHLEALREFRAAYEKVKDPHLALNMGRTLFKLGRYREALTSYALARKPGQLAESRQQELRDLIGETQAAIDAQPSLSMRPSIRVATGAVSFAPNINAEVKVSLPAEALQPRPGAPVASKVPTYKQPWLWTSIAIGACAIAAGVTVAVTSQPARSEPPVPIYDFLTSSIRGSR